MKGRTRRRALAFLTVLVLAVSMLPGLASAASVVPTLVGAGPDPSYPGYTAYKYDPPTDNTYTIPGGTITFSKYNTSNGQEMNWSSTLYVGKVLVKGGSQGGYLYDYGSTGVTGDTGLHAPVTGGSGKWANISHVVFYVGAQPVIKGSITVNKTDGQNPLAGATFALYQGSTMVAGSQVTMDAGSHTWSDLALGTYTVTEISAPAGYNMPATTSQTVTLTTSNKDQTVTFVNSLILGSITVNKTDGTNPLAGATFALYQGSTMVGSQVIMSTDSHMWSNLPLGVYTVTEISAPAGYNMPATTSQTVTLTTSNKDQTVTFVNSLILGAITVYKYDQYEEELPGATFALYQGVDEVPGSRVTMSTYMHTWSGLAPGTYRVVEISAPNGYTMADPNYQDVTLPVGEHYWWAVWFMNEETSQELGSITVTKNGGTLVGATFALYFEDETTPRHTTTMTSGTHTWYNLELGDYTVVETAPPPGYQLANPASQTVTLHGEGSLDVTLNFVNQPILGTITVHKLTGQGQPLTGAMFTLHLGQTQIGSEIAILNADGTYTWTGLALGTYTVTETEAPAGYTIAGSPSGDVTISAGSPNGHIYFQNNPAQPSLGSLQIVKQWYQQPAPAPEQVLPPLLPHAGVTFTITGPAGYTTSGVTNELGVILLTGLVPGSYTVTETIPAGYTNATPVQTTTVVGNANETALLYFHNVLPYTPPPPPPPPPPQSTLVVRVVKTDSGNVGGLTVNLTGALNAALATNASGIVTLSGIDAGLYTANSGDAGYTSDGPRSTTVPVGGSGEIVITLTPVPPPPPPPPAIGNLHGIVREKGTLTRLPGATVVVYTATATVYGTVTTDSSGEFFFADVPLGNYTATASLTGYTSATDGPVPVVLNETAEMLMELERTIVVPPEEPETPKTGISYTSSFTMGMGLVLAGLAVGRRRGRR
jgi:uncharacterized surface anchored protein